MSLSIRDIKNRAHAFAINFKDAKKENAESQTFLNEFFEIFGISRRKVAVFEQAVKTYKLNGRIDLFWPNKLLIEMKSTGKDLEKAFAQAIDYTQGIKDEDMPEYIMVCDLDRFYLYDLENSKQHSFLLENIVENLHLFGFMNDKHSEDITELELNEKAAELLGKLHDSLENSGYKGHDLQIFMIRILFILFAEDTNVFNRHQFTVYVDKFTDKTGLDVDMHIHKLFQILDTEENKRNLNLADELNDFPYVNGDLFMENIKLPSFTQQMRENLLECCIFNWKTISPAIFGSLFQSIMNKVRRRTLGAHYTSEENIMKVIDPLFLNDLKGEFKEAIAHKNKNMKNKKLINLMEKIRNIKILDPACGCGNFLIIAYRELRLLELEIMKVQNKSEDQDSLCIEIEPQITLNNFYGIEIDEWPARIAEVAMWLTQHQMNLEFAKHFGREPDLLPLKEHVNIRHGNALTLDWNDVVDKTELDYIIGNPPFVGKRFRSKEQSLSQEIVLGGLVRWKNMDFVCNWFYKSSLFIKKTQIQASFVATNSITMGEQVGLLWDNMFNNGVFINFAYRSFKWENNSKGKAAVNCVIIGFGVENLEEKTIFSTNEEKKLISVRASNINPYIINTNNVTIKSRSESINSNFKMMYGNMPVDAGFLFLNKTERNILIKENANIKKWIKPVMGCSNLIKGTERFCLWLVDSSVAERKEIMKISEVRNRIEQVRDFRSSRDGKRAVETSETPWLFTSIRQEPNTNYILVPRVSSSKREYLPIGFCSSDYIFTDSVFMIGDAKEYEFGLLISCMHMDWLRTIGGRMKSDYQYSKNIVYNNFPWPTITEKQKENISVLAQDVLDARQLEFDADEKTSLADLYDPNTMPIKLRKAHKALDKAADELYKKGGFNSPLERVKHLFEMYEELTNQPTKKDERKS